jgi:alanyl-tRNA synthetase
MSQNTHQVPRTSVEIRDSFIKFFESKGHLFVRSSPVVPQDDPTLMFINAGMNQFKACFLGDNPKAYKRVANSQKCIRVSGKHNDLDEVGRDTYHHTLFEMLGNWSFGDYYKEEAITWAWELLTQVWQLPVDRLFVTVYEDDDEAAQIWTRVSGLPQDRIMRFGAKSNFWEMGDTGPCGPCTEIHFDKGDLATQASTFADPEKGVNGTNDRYIEIWNNVFMQFERISTGELLPLKNKHVDTGMGFERVCAILQNVRSNYDTDVFTPLISKIAELSGVPYAQDMSGMPHRVIADHLRALSFAIADGALPSNEGRGYVLRRILRRASRYARLLGQKEAIIYKVVPVLAELMGDAFPEIRERASFVAEVIRSEEERFIRTLDAGLDRFDKIAAELQGTTVIAGDKVFLLYDTYGFPPDLTRLLAEEKGLSIDEPGFEKSMNEQKERARGAQKQVLSAGGSEGWTIYAEGSTEFLGYDLPSCEVKVLRFREDAGMLSIILDRTPFYAESGGQVGERGKLEGKGLEIEIVDTIKLNDIWFHRAKVTKGVANAETMGDVFVATINSEERAAVRKNHSATHLLQSALQKVMGSHVAQQGSRVASDILRFDFTALTAPTWEQLLDVENLVNAQIQACLPVRCDKMAIAEAQKSGAMALFGEKYGDVVRVIGMGSFSKELCGGLHVSNTGEIGSFRILTEASVSAGVRRIEATTAFGALAKAREESGIVAALRDRLRCKTEQVLERLEASSENTRKLEKELASLKSQVAQAKAGDLLVNPAEVKGVQVWTINTQVSPEEFSAILDGVQTKLSLGVAVLANTQSDAGAIAVVVHPELVKKGVKAGDLIKKLAEICGGRGGGRPDRAQAGTREPAKIADAVQASAELIASLL